ncbi:g1344 [Coccomyxa viridis]|uniref:G1344 protein n=1 Tax=Coccomyxa viridis TaxID=1274662 RepID=A0ABP1FN75_9CHLO
MPKKRSAAAEAAGDAEHDPESKIVAEAVKDEVDEKEEEEKKPKKRAKKTKEPVNEEPHEALEGPKWLIHPPWLMYREGEPASSSKIAAFDLDGTLVVQKTAGRFVTSASDWKLFNKDVPKVLKEYFDKGYKIVVFSNQGGIASQLDGKQSVKLRERAEQAFEKIDVPATIMYATGKEGCGVRKPELGMWDFFVENLNDGVQPEKGECFFVGDAAGRAGDFAGSDKEFAENVGIAFKTPEEVFGEGPKKAFSPTKQEGPKMNPELGSAFDQLAAKFADDRFKGIAFKKVADIINSYPEKITSGKQVSHVKGVGKGSIAKIDEFLKTGTFAELESSGGVQKTTPAGEAPEGDAKMALNFL